MKGDFSWFDHRPEANYTGVLEQQGRVRLDRDGNAAEEIARGLRNMLGRDAFGPGRVAVPSEAPGSFEVTAAAVTANGVKVAIQPGRAWVDGLALIETEGGSLPATYLGPPHQPAVGPDSIAAGVRDAVVLEIWEDALSAFQHTGDLLEPGLGGPDTTERVKIFRRIRLFRLGEDDDCRTIADALRDDPSGLGRLTATPAPAMLISGDCPVEAGGGYTGDGHVLICVEIAPDDGDAPRFVWSRHGGGLVGRGVYDDVAQEIAITHNLPFIENAMRDTMRLHALAQDPSGVWTVRFEADVTFTDGVLSVSDPSGTWPAGETAFFRLWDGAERISDFTTSTEIADGIMLEFDAPSADGSNYRPGDRWFFQARAAGVAFDPSRWPNQAPPSHLRYRRAPLAILNWTGGAPTELGPDEIDDCRDGFAPLTDPCCCCTITVGDGRRSHGDTDSIEEALARLPRAGGRICLLPGVHETNAVLSELADFAIVGCGKATRVVPRPGRRDEPIFTIEDSECVTLENMEMISLSGVAVYAASTDDDALRQLTVKDNRILACVRAIQVEGGTGTVIQSNLIRMLDKRGAGVAVYLAGEDGRIEDNDVGVVPAAATPRPPQDPDGEDDPDDPNDPCAEPDTIYGNFGFLVVFAEFVFGFVLTAIVPPPYRALGGVQIGAGAERIAVIDNRIRGGAGNGITLGGSHVDPRPGEQTGPAFQTLTLGRSVMAIRGVVSAPEGVETGGVALQMTAPSGAAQTAVTEDGGGFGLQGSGEAGEHRFEAVDPAIGVQSIEVLDITDFAQGSLVTVAVELNRQSQEPQDPFGYLYGVRIEDNDISAMGLNGIASPPPREVLPEAPERETPVRDLDREIARETDEGARLERERAREAEEMRRAEIAREREAAGEPQPVTVIAGSPSEARRRAAAPSNARPMAAAPPRAALTLDTAAAVNPLLARLGNPIVDLTIRDNRIVDCLRTPFTTAMRDAARVRGFGGISLGLCDTVTIASNRIEGNGRRHVDPVCGVFVLLGEQVEIVDNLIRDNGPYVGNVNAEVERGLRGGVVGIFLSAGMDAISDATPAAYMEGKPAFRLHNNVIQQPMGRALTVIGAGPMSIVANHLATERTGQEDLDVMAGAALAFSISGLGQLPTGGTMMNSNQIRLGAYSDAFIAVALAAAEDLGFDGNQVDAMQSGQVSGRIGGSMNTVIFAGSARATGNRFREGAIDAAVVFQVSLLSLTAAMNVATSNQGDHCVFAYDLGVPIKQAVGGNVVLDDTMCPGLNGIEKVAALNPVYGAANQSNLRFAQEREDPQGDAKVVAADLERNLRVLNAHQQSQLVQAADMKAQSRALLGNEVARLRGRASVRADVLARQESKLAAASMESDRLRAAAQIVATKPTPPSDDAGLVVVGRVTNANGRGLLAAEVTLTDASGETRPGAPTAVTDANGGYRIELPAAEAEALRGRVSEGAVVVARPAEEGARPVVGERFEVASPTVVAPDVRAPTRGDAAPPAGAGARPGRTEAEQPLTRPTLEPRRRLDATSGRISPLLRGARPRGPEG